ncbi:hypothetical protein, partial [Streptomyces sp. MK5]|uniref:hypothetical protein n=1 Tax=Streptomyces sp. MK5 TaxID=3064253 RepID=UPI0027415519
PIVAGRRARNGWSAVTAGTAARSAAVVIRMPGLPEVVVEIGSAPNAASAQKLAFAREAGAYPLWVRFGSGGIEKIDCVMVLDIRDAVSGVCEAGSG